MKRGKLRSIELKEGRNSMRPNEKPKRRGPQILVPVDFSAATAGLMAYARHFARRNKLNITLLHVVEPLHPDWHMDTTGLQRQRREQAHQALTGLLAREFPGSRSARAELREGHPVETIVRFARESRADLILIATHGRTGLKRALLGSVAERVARHAPCPVLVVR